MLKFLLQKGRFQADLSVPSSVYPNGFFETLRSKGHKIPFWPWHEARMRKTAVVFNFQLETVMIREALEKLLTDNFTLNSEHRVRLTFYGMDKRMEVRACIESADHAFCVEAPYSVISYPFESKYSGPFSSFKLLENTLYARALEYALKEGTDEALMMNQFGNPIETSRFNIFMLKNGIWHTPSSPQGQVEGVMIAFLKDMQFFNDLVRKPLRYSELLNADEIVMTNAFRGIVGVKWLNGREFQWEMGKLMQTSLRNVWLNA